MAVSAAAGHQTAQVPTRSLLVIVTTLLPQQADTSHLVLEVGMHGRVVLLC